MPSVLPLCRTWQNNVVMADASNLNSEQRRAVEHGEGPLLVIAGPGSGKTRVITHRIIHLLESATDLQPENILALTFTDKAAGEMHSRVRRQLPYLEKRPFIATFHAFCYHVLRGWHFDRRLLDKIDVWIFLRRRMEQLALQFYQKLAEPGAFLHDLNDFFSRCQDELIEPDEFELYVRRLEEDLERATARIGPTSVAGRNRGAVDPTEHQQMQEEIERKKELAHVFRRSRELLEQAGCSSLGSLISETVRLWDREPETLQQYRQRFRFVLVDEFQDTNYVQVQLLRRLVAAPFNITAVGDDDQAIYRFRGASHGAFEMFDQLFPAHETVYLNQNYRSTRKILRVAETAIARNDRYEAKPVLRTDNPEGHNVCLLDTPNYPSEATWVADEVLRLTQRGRAWGEIAVLYRSHNYRDLLVEEFRRRNIPFNIRGLSVLSTTILRDLVAYLNLVHSPHHNVSLTRVLLAPRWRFPEELALDVRRQAGKDRCSLFDVLEARERTASAQLAGTGWSELKALLRNLQSAARHASMTALFDMLKERLALSLPPESRDRVYVGAFRKFLADWEEKSGVLGAPGSGALASTSNAAPKSPLQEFMEYLAYFREAGGQIEVPELDGQSEAVQMMTVHAAKGLEFPIVFVVSVAPQRFPHREETPVIEFPDELRKGPPAPANIHLQEERRLFYVALTRARERLYISSVAKKRPSSFVEDLLSNPVVRARDIERIAVPALAASRGQPPAASGAGSPASHMPLRAPAPAGTSVLFSEHASSTPQAPLQRSLFEDAVVTPPPDLSAVHPPISEWASRPAADASDGKLLLSATAIEAYRDCPLKFKFSHYLRVPTAPQAALTFGSLMHQCVRHYFSLRREGMPRAEDMEEFYLRSWKALGFEDAYQEEAYKKAGREQLRAFVERQSESLFDAHQIRTEERFRMELSDVVLQGRIDQIKPCGNGRQGKPTVELVDYKTGRPRSQKDADRSLQLSVYALAAHRELQMNPERLTFYNLTNNQSVSTVRTEKDLENAVADIEGVAASIRQGLFDPTPGFVCKRCEFAPLCPVHEGQ